MLNQQQDQYVDGFETTETQYSKIVHNVVYVLASLMLDQGKDYHHHYVCISHQLHPGLLYAFFW